jgi:hypothetical protein
MNEELTDLSVRYAEEVENEVIPDDIPLPIVADEVVRGKRILSRDQMRLLIELLPYHLPKLSAMAIARIDGKSFAEALDRCIERSQKPVPRFNGPVEELPTTVAKKPMAHFRRF